MQSDRQTDRQTHLEHAVVDESQSSLDEDDVQYVDDVTDEVVDDPPVDAVVWCLVAGEVRHDIMLIVTGRAGSTTTAVDACMHHSTHHCCNSQVHDAPTAPRIDQLA